MIDFSKKKTKSAKVILVIIAVILVFGFVAGLLATM